MDSDWSVKVKRLSNFKRSIEYKVEEEGEVPTNIEEILGKNFNGKSL